MTEEPTLEAGEELEKDLSREKEIKVKIPLPLYLKLHQHKIINGDLLKDVVQEALDGYLAEIEEKAAATEEEG